MPPDEIPPSASTMRKSLSKAPSKETIFWMSALFELREMSRRRPSVRLRKLPITRALSRKSNKERTIPDDVSLILEHLDEMTETAWGREDVKLNGIGSRAEKGAE